MTPKEYEVYSDACEEQARFYVENRIDSFRDLVRYRRGKMTDGRAKRLDDFAKRIRTAIDDALGR